MALFADIKTPYVNEATLKRVMSARVKDNIFQGIFTRPGEAVTEKFSEDTNAAQIQVIRVLPNNTEAREIGADKNGGWFNNQEAATPKTAAYGIDIITTIDDCIDIPTNQEDMMHVDVAEAELSNLAGRVNKNVNAITIAAQLCKNFNNFRSTTGSENWIELTDDDYLGAIISAGAQLDDGNEDEGVDAYPQESRAVFIRSDVKAALYKKGQLIVGGSNAAQNIIRKGGLDEDTTPDVAATGYVGEVDGMPCYVASKAVWNLVEKYLGLAAGTLANVKILVVSALGTGRALAFNNAIKMIDSPAGQGRRLQPKYRMGAECWDALSVVPVISGTFENPAKGAELRVTAPGSR